MYTDNGHAGLILTRRPHEVTIIGGDASGRHTLFDADGNPVEITLTLIGVRGNHVRIGVAAPKSVPVHRLEIEQRIRKETRARASGKVAESAVAGAVA